MILITGAAQGLGAAIALRLAQERHPLLLHYRHTPVDPVADRCRALGSDVETFQTDLSGPFQPPTRLTGLVNNVGFYLVRPLVETSEAQWRDLMEVNFHAPRRLMQAAAPSLIRHGGAIVNIGQGGTGPHRRSAAYRVSKDALWSLTQAYAANLPIPVNMVSPGEMENSVDQPLGRATPLSEVADRVASLLLHPEGTGQNLEL